MDIIWSSLLVTVTVPSNVFIIALYFRSQKIQRKPRFTLLCNQAVTDLLAGTIIIPLVVACDFKEVGAASYIICFVFFAGLLNRFLMSLDKYLAVTKPLRYRVIVSKENVRSLVIAVWCTSFCSTIIPLSWEYLHSSNENTIKDAYTAILLSLIILQTIGILYLNAITYARFRGHLQGRIFVTKGYQRTKATKSMTKRLKKATMQFVLLTSLVSITYMPIIYINIAYSFKRKQESNYTANAKASLYLFGVYAFVNPVISLWLFRDLKRAANVSLQKLRARTRRFRIGAAFRNARRGFSNCYRYSYMRTASLRP